MPAAPFNLSIVKGATFNRVLRWEAAPPIFKPITAIAQSAPVLITAPSHGVPDGWRVAVVSVQGMKQINAPNDPPTSRDYSRAHVLDGDSLELVGLNASEFLPYRSGGYLRFNTPVPLAGYEARMSIKDKVGGVELLRLDTDNGRIVLDADAFTISLLIDAEDTAAIVWSRGIYDLEMQSADGVVTPLITGSVQVIPEVTTT